MNRWDNYREKLKLEGAMVEIDGKQVKEVTLQDIN